MSLTSMAYRGVNTGLEFRFRDWGGKGTYRLDYLHDQDPPTIDLDAPYEDRVQEDRYWLRGMTDFKTSSGFVINMDIDFVSDPDYLYEFRRSFTGYNRTDTQFQRNSGAISTSRWTCRDPTS